MLEILDFCTSENWHSKDDYFSIFSNSHTQFSIKPSLNVFSFFINSVEPVYAMYILFVLVLFPVYLKSHTSTMVHMDLQTLEEFGSRIVLYTVLGWYNFNV